MVENAVIRADFDIEATLASGQTFAFTKVCDMRDGAAGDRIICFRGVVNALPVRISRVFVAGTDENGENVGSGMNGGIGINGTGNLNGGIGGMSGVIGGMNGGIGINDACRAYGSHYEIECAARDEAFFSHYFDLDASYGSVLAEFIGGENRTQGHKHEYLAMCVQKFGGLRLLRQPVWEALCAFIISANNHQKRIESLYRRLSVQYGERVFWDGDAEDCEYYAFPSPAKLAEASLDDMWALGLGYRAPYMLDTAKVIADSGLPDLDSLCYDEALKALMALRGVGEKVADCVLLFSTRHGRAFPVDVWMDRAMRKLYGMTGSRKAIKRGAQEMYGDSAGLCQQFIFHGMRTGLLI